MSNRLSKKITFGYSTGSFAESAAYNFVAAFLLIYLTDIAGISPVTAGTITSAAMVIESFTGIAIGRISDSLTSRFGRRRPFMLISVPLLPVTLVMAFTKVNLSSSLQFAYYIAITGIFWTCYSIMYIPYTALGAEITTDYDERTRLRTAARVMGITGGVIGNTCPLLITALLIRRGLAEHLAWTGFAAMLGAACALAIFISWYMTKGTEAPGLSASEEKKEPFMAVLKDYVELIRLKAMRRLLIYKVLFNLAYSTYTASMIYFLQYKLSLGSEVSSSVYMLANVVCILSTPFISWLAIRLDKQKQLVMAMVAGGLGGLLLRAVGIDSYGTMLIYVAVFAFAQSSFWQVSNAIFYDITEVDDYVYNKRREGSITSLQSIIGTLSSAAALQILGILLNGAGFDPALEQQSQQAVNQLVNIFVLYPSAGLLLSGVVLMLYPLSKKRFLALQGALAARDNGTDSSPYDEDVKKIL